jgi:DNA-binding HxlR family transcriptional regulator
MVLFALMEDGTSKSLSHMCDTAEACDFRQTLDRVGDKWSLLVISMLGSGPLRFMELRRQIGSISQRMLTLTLRHLERDGLVQRTVYPTIPPKVEYRLTALGGTLLESIQAIVLWTLEHREEIAKSRAKYDARPKDVEPVPAARPSV